MCMIRICYSDLVVVVTVKSEVRVIDTSFRFFVAGVFAFLLEPTNV